MDDLLKDAIADAKAVRETAIANAKLALEEAFTPKLQNMLSQKIQNEIEIDEEEHDEEDVEEEMDDEEAKEEGRGDMRRDGDEVEEEGRGDDDDMEEDAHEEDEVEEDGHEGEEDVEEEESDEDELDLEAIIKELEAEINEEDEDEVEEGRDDKEKDEVKEEDEDDEAKDEVKEEEEDDDSKDEVKEDSEFNLDEILDALKEDSDEEDDKEMDEVSKLRSELDETREAVKFMRDKLNEVNLLNAKLLFTNKLFRAYGLNNEQKMKVVETFDRASNLREVKLVYSTLGETFGAKKTEIKESKGSASKAVASTKSEKQGKVITEGDTMRNRFKKLANII